MGDLNRRNKKNRSNLLLIELLTCKVSKNISNEQMEWLCE